MLVRNKLIKALGYMFIWLVTFIEAFLLAVLTAGILFSLICAVWSFITPLPAYIATKYGILLLVGAIPFAVCYFIYIAIQARKK